MLYRYLSICCNHELVNKKGRRSQKIKFRATELSSRSLLVEATWMQFPLSQFSKWPKSLVIVRILFPQMSFEYSDVLSYIKECCCHVSSNARLDGLTLRMPCHTSYIGKVCHQYVFSYALSIHLNGQTSSHNLSSCKCKAFHQYAFFDEPSNGWTLCSSCHIQDDHRYEWVASFSAFSCQSELS